MNFKMLVGDEWLPCHEGGQWCAGSGHSVKMGARSDGKGPCLTRKCAAPVATSVEGSHHRNRNVVGAALKA